MKNAIILFSAMFLLFACAKKSDPATQLLAQKNIVSNQKAKITFVELGSTTCIPCKKMQEVMKNVESKYQEQIKVVFYDVNKDKSAGDKYKVEMIPTQVFLDSNGTEFFRHVGYFPEAEIDKIFQNRGLTIATQAK